MSSAGHVLDMISQMKYNSAQKKARREKIKLRELNQSHPTEKHQKTDISIPKHSKKELEAALKYIRQQAENQRKRMQILYGLVGIISLLILLLAFIYL